jgi:hypothetical protein
MMFVHHVATLALLWLSWGDNFTRVGSLILVIHDFADITLEVRTRAPVHVRNASMLSSQSACAT